jgi:hypothetical protein
MEFGAISAHLFDYSPPGWGRAAVCPRLTWPCPITQSTLLHRLIMPDYALLGYPISQSLAPAVHNACFELQGSSSRYELMETSHIDSAMCDWIKGDACKGAA